MDLAHPISTVVPTLDGPVLATLARTSQPLTGRRVHQLTETGSEAGVRKVLTRLVDTGLVTATRVGPSLQYALNRRHLAADAVLELSALRGRMVLRMKSEIEQRDNDQIVHASIFGSAARGDGDLDSDIDLLLVCSSDEALQSLSDWIAQLGEGVHAWTGNFLQTYAITTDELTRHLVAADPLVNEWLRDSITVHGPEFRRLRSEISRDVMGQ